MLSAPIAIADWIRSAEFSSPDAMTHLKLQKLAFYGFGAILAHGLESRLSGPVRFEAWKHGPVNPEIYLECRDSGIAALSPASARGTLPRDVAEILRATMNVFGRLTAWQLREETHDEKPWRDHFTGAPNIEIPTDELRVHFKKKFTGAVQFPERLFGNSSMALDRLAVPSFTSFDAMSRAATHILG